MSTRPTPTAIMRSLGLEPDPWQVQVLEGNHQRLLLNCSRQAGKSTVVALLSLVEALYRPTSLILLLSRSLRQSSELFRQVVNFHRRLSFLNLEHRSAHELLLKNQSRIVSLPCTPDTIRGFSKVHLLVIDEAARVPDELYRSVRPMLAVSHGRLICLSTPHGKHGFFHDAWVQGGPDWTRIEVQATQIERISPEFLDEERRCLGESYFRQEYCCSFEALHGLVYTDFGRCVVPALPAHLSEEKPGEKTGRKVGGIDFGFRNPFAAVWGILDRDDVLWLTGEHYASQQPLSYHAAHLPKGYRWYADPSGATEISELRCANFTISGGDNSLRPGIAAVTARLNDGRLRVLQDRCPHLLAEAGLYRYSPDPEDRRSETPVDQHNHALAALRYLVSKLDERKMARFRQAAAPGQPPPATEAPKPPKKPWLSIWNEDLWDRLH